MLEFLFCSSPNTKEAESTSQPFLQTLPLPDAEVNVQPFRQVENQMPHLSRPGAAATENGKAAGTAVLPAAQ